MSVKGRIVLACPLLLMLVVGLGCSKGNVNTPAKLSGSVKYKGGPVTGGTMTLLPEGGGAIPVTIKPDGTYAAQDLPVGTLKVVIETESMNPNKKGDPSTYGQQGGGRGGSQSMSPIPTGRSTAAGGTYVKIPEKYSDVKSSGLSVTLQKGDNSHDFDLTD